MNSRVYIEGGGDSKELRIRCRAGFRKLFENAGFSGKMPRTVACGGRNSTFDFFGTAHASRKSREYVAMLVDSEDPVADIEKTWEHLNQRDKWEKPADADDEQVLLMTTCMETWIAADREALREYYGQGLTENRLPSLNGLENRGRHDVQDRLVRATRNCSKVYSKGKSSFAVLATLNPSELKKFLPSFARVIRILDEKLK